ncbi:MAG TPA: tRNA uridine-5-carboxymethylaminomethyl(34) synthesis GTPase MnmE [Steroidobacteraceae bacterium]|nr:tRNA uridine-5-carboxymethylaminomethyl(34) synthesis GTPase MnmE [Steroidobacteraceae bacterium]
MGVGAHTDTIVAIATPSGRGGIGLVRVSGTAVPAIAEAICGRTPEPRVARVRSFIDATGALIDTGLALYFPGPGSYTGEDVLELHAHGSPVVLDLLLARITELGARLAEPGEFTRRAFLNDKLDLAQAEAVADLIDSSSVQAARAAMRSLQGEFSRAVTALVEALVQTRMYVEAAIDFPEEEVDFLSDTSLHTRLAGIREDLHRLLARAEQGALLRNGFKVVIAGKPNAGKSSLLNALAGYDAAIVTSVPGTTRDVLREQVNIDGLVIQLADTAGLRDEADIVEAEGIRRAQREMQHADHVLYVVDVSRPEFPVGLAAELEPLRGGATLVFNKIDVSRPAAALDLSLPVVAISAATHAGLDELRSHLKRIAGQHADGEDVFLARRRHLDALHRAESHLQQAEYQLQHQRAGELAAEELRRAQEALSEITGEFTSDDLLGRIFASFCIGK